MNLSEVRQRHPLVIVVLAVFVMAVCFAVVPATSFSGVFVQTAVLGLCMLALLALTEPSLLLRGARIALVKRAGHPQSGKQFFSFATALLMVNALFIGIVAVINSEGGSSGDEGLTLLASSLPPFVVGVIFIATCVATGIFEECLFRGIMFRGFFDALRIDGKKNPALFAAIISAVVFGLLHTTDAPAVSLDSVTFTQIILKTTQAIMFGFVMSALLLRLNTLWPIIALHAGFNILSMMPTFVLTAQLPTTYLTGNPADLVAVVGSVTLLLPLVVYSWLILQNHDAQSKK